MTKPPFRVEYLDGDESGRVYERVYVPPPPITESVLQRMLLERYPRVLPNLRLFRRNVGFGTTAAGQPFKAGIKGQADLYGYSAHTTPATPIELELKSVSGALSKEQALWAQFCKRFNVPHLVLRAQRSETAEETIVRWIEEIQTLLGVP